MTLQQSCHFVASLSHRLLSFQFSAGCSCSVYVPERSSKVDKGGEKVYRVCVMRGRVDQRCCKSLLEAKTTDVTWL